jgi:hypothetical protein
LTTSNTCVVIVVVVVVVVVGKGCIHRRHSEGVLHARGCKTKVHTCTYAHTQRTRTLGPPSSQLASQRVGVSDVVITAAPNEPPLACVRACVCVCVGCEAHAQVPREGHTLQT